MLWGDASSLLFLLPSPNITRERQVSPAQDSDKIQICKIASATVDLQFNETSREILDILAVPVPRFELLREPLQGVSWATAVTPKPR
jgi:hypothetical protein